MRNYDVDMVSVSSSNVESVGYDEKQHILYVRFLSGGLYIYKGVSRKEFENLRDADSVGSYLNRNIKGKYPYERIE